MNLMMLLEMAAGAEPDRIAVGDASAGLTSHALMERAGRAAAAFRSLEIERVIWTDVASPGLPVALFGSSWAGLPFVPVNYRLADEPLRSIVSRQAPAVVICGAGTEERIAGIDGLTVLNTVDFWERTGAGEPAEPTWSDDSDDVALLLHTSGTSGEPKIAVLRQRHLVSYVLNAVEFLGATADEASLVTVPPYHIAGVAAILTATFSGRRLVQLPNFEPTEWVATARMQAITHAMVVPTMLSRINDVLAEDRERLPGLRHLAYGGGRMPVPVIERAMALMPNVSFVNAYGLTETSSSIAVLGPDDHRTALASDDPAVRARLGSVGKPLATVEISIRDPDGVEVPAGTAGEVWVRGEQVSGEYAHASADDDTGWFMTRDSGYFDDGGYLYVTGRLDDVIVRGGENLSPAEIEDVLLQHPDVREACVFGVPDDEWGESVGAVVVAGNARQPSSEELTEWIVQHLRSSRRPSVVEFRSELPTSPTGKVLRRVLRDELSTSSPFAGSR